MRTFDDRVPIYQQIAEQVRDSILSGELAEEDQVMSTTQYATTYRINPATAGKAMNILVEEGLIHKRRGIGMFVCQGAQSKLRAERRSTFFEDELAPVLEQARLLSISKDEIITYIKEEKR